MSASILLRNTCDTLNYSNPKIDNCKRILNVAVGSISVSFKSQRKNIFSLLDKQLNRYTFYQLTTLSNQHRNLKNKNSVDTGYMNYLDWEKPVMFSNW